MSQIIGDELELFFEMMKNHFPFYSADELLEKDKLFVQAMQALKRPNQISELTANNVFDNGDGLFNAGKLFEPNSERYFHLLDYSFSFPNENLWQSEYRDLLEVETLFQDMPYLRQNAFDIFVELHRQAWEQKELNLVEAIGKTDLSDGMVEAILNYENIYAAINGGTYPLGSLNHIVRNAVKLSSNIQIRLSQTLLENFEKIEGIDEWTPDLEAIDYIHSPKQAETLFKTFPNLSAMKQILSLYSKMKSDLLKIVESEMTRIRRGLQEKINEGLQQQSERQIEDIWNSCGPHFKYTLGCELVKIKDEKPRVVKGRVRRIALELLVKANKNVPVSLARILAEAAPERENKNAKISDYFKGHFLEPFIKYSSDGKGYYLDFDGN